MSRLLAIGLAGLLAGLVPAFATLAQTQSTRPGAHAGTQIAFPASVGGATLERSVNYAAPPNNRPDQGIRSADDMFQALLGGNTYVNVHSQVNPGGEIRGQLIVSQ